MKQTGLVLEGGGMRGLYTAGVLEYFMQKELYFPYVIGVSAGACMAASYLSRQKGRNKQVNVDLAGHPKYISYKNLFMKKELFGMDFLFDEIPNKLVPFDYGTFAQAAERLVIGTTDCYTGEPVYYEPDERDDILKLLRASSSLPFMAPPVPFQGRTLLDGGISDPIPIKKSEREGFKKNIVILTQAGGYRKKKARMGWMTKRRYPQFQGLHQSLISRPQHYNETLDYIEDQTGKKKTLVIRPRQKLEVGRVERNPEKLFRLYRQGYHEAEEMYPEITRWLKED